MTAISQSLNLTESHLRPFDPRRDLTGVADLVELCFADTLDADGRRYIEEIRSAARFPTYLRWASLTNANTATPLMGFVWMESGRIVGNLSLIPFKLDRRRNYLIANVAVSPGYRRQGIARNLTIKALEHCRQLGADNIWLHVRQGNKAAIRLYESLGFREQARRTTWESAESYGATKINGLPPTGIGITRLRPSLSTPEWPKIRSWLEYLYPPEIRWHLPYDPRALRGDLWGSLYRIMMDIDVRLWVATYNQKWIGMLAWQPFQNQADILWLACAPANEDLVVYSLIPHLYRQIRSQRRVVLDYPADQGVQAFSETGMQAHQTLIWMSVDLSR